MIADLLYLALTLLTFTAIAWVAHLIDLRLGAMNAPGPSADLHTPAER